MRTASKDAGASPQVLIFLPSSLTRTSLSLEKRRKSRIEASAAARATKIATALPTWETSILPNWRSVLHPNAEGLALRKLWWSGTMPVRWRGRLWGLCVGNGLAVSKNSFTGHLARARKGVEDGSFPVEVMKQLEDDVERTLPTLKLFQKGGVMHEELVDLLLAYTVYANEQPRYVSLLVILELAPHGLTDLSRRGSLQDCPVQRQCCPFLLVIEFPRWPPLTLWRLQPRQHADRRSVSQSCQPRQQELP
jgi:hypothetical protein